ncbi:hypothetical protein L7F22_037952 [Adiantum nelumboides]|nr:hypothetical protein [Adiantum nelumboides]
MKTRQQNIPSEYEESEEAERLDSESSDDSEYAPASKENSSEDNDQAHEDSPSASRGTGATDKISTSEIPRPSNALSDNPIQVVFHLNPPKHALSEVFSPQQLSQLGLQSLAQMAQLISESDTPGSSQAPATDKGKRPLSGRGVQTRGGHSKRTKVSRDSAADLSSLPFSQSHDTRSLRTQTSSHISPTPITTPTGRTMVSSAPQPIPQMISPIGTVDPAPSTIVHQTGLTAATTISMEPSTSTPTPSTSAPQGITHFMSRADKLLQMERSATLTIANAINTIHGAQKMHAVTYESMYEELLDTHQRVYDRDVEKAALFDRNRILNRQVKDLKDVISSLHLQLREAQKQLQQKSVVTTMVCERCAQIELTVTTSTPVAPISLPTQGIPTTYSEYLTALEDEFAELKQKGMPVLSYSNKLLTLAQQIGSIKKKTTSLRSRVGCLKQSVRHELIWKHTGPTKEQTEQTETVVLLIGALPVTIQDYHGKADFHIMKLGNCDVLLGMPWHDKNDATFQITERINDVSFQLRLPDTWKIHNAFHVSLLKPFRGDVPNDGEPDEQPEVEENKEMLVPEKILAHKDTKTKGKVRRRFLVKFKNYPALDAKWIEEEDLANSPQIVKLYLEFGLA